MHGETIKFDTSGAFENRARGGYLDQIYKIRHGSCTKYYYSIKQMLSTTSVWNISHSENNWVRWWKMHIGLYVKYSLFLSDFNETWIFSTDFRKNIQISNFMKIRPVGAKLFHADGRTDMTKLIVAFRNFANAPKNRLWNHHPSVCVSRFQLVSL